MKFNTNKAREKNQERDKKIAQEKGTLLEIGKKYDLTKQRVSQIKIKLKVEETGKVNIKHENTKNN